tara:strand:+ start:225 stop:503 length:279 start_codon:yes stop_codon:yes gene_type:complete
MLKIFLIILLFFLIEVVSNAQCSMCKSIVQSEISSGNQGISSGINFGIIYLFSSTYLLLIIGSILWYFRSKKEQKKVEIKNNISERIASIHN